MHWIYAKVLINWLICLCYLPFHARKHFFNSLILPSFYYCDIVWGDRANDTAMMSLQILQNRAAKEILDLPFLSSASDALHRLGWKPLCHQSKEHRCSSIYKCINNFIDSDFIDSQFYWFSVFNKDPTLKTALGSCTVASRAAVEWNSLDKSIRSIDNLNSFKKSVHNLNF